MHTACNNYKSTDLKTIFLLLTYTQPNTFPAWCLKSHHQSLLLWVLSPLQNSPLIVTHPSVLEREIMHLSLVIYDPAPHPTPPHTHTHTHTHCHTPRVRPGPEGVGNVQVILSRGRRGWLGGGSWDRLEPSLPDSDLQRQPNTVMSGTLEKNFSQLLLWMVSGSWNQYNGMQYALF